MKIKYVISALLVINCQFASYCQDYYGDRYGDKQRAKDNKVYNQQQIDNAKVNRNTPSTRSSNTPFEWQGEVPYLFQTKEQRAAGEAIRQQKLQAEEQKRQAAEYEEQLKRNKQNINKNKKFDWQYENLSVYTSQGLTSAEAFEALALQYFATNKDEVFPREEYHKAIALLSKFKETLATGTLENLKDLIWDSRIFAQTSTNNLNILKQKFPQNLEYIEKYELLIMNYYFGAQKQFAEDDHRASYPEALVEIMTFEDQEKLYNRFTYLANKYPKIALLVAGHCREHLNPFDMVREAKYSFMNQDNAVRFEAAKNVLLSEYPRMEIDNKDYLFWIEFYNKRLRNTVAWILANYPDYFDSLSPTDWARIRKAQNTDFYYINIAFRKDLSNYDCQYPALKKAMKGKGFDKGPQSGNGTIFTELGDYYEGNFENYIMSGKGKLTQKNGTIYEGNFVDGKYSGQGKMTYLSGAFYDGNWENGEQQGVGSLRFDDGDFYTGNWVKGKRQGKGKLTYKNGGIYEGDYVNNMQSGTGVFTYASGDRYEGEFLDNAFHGKAKQINVSGYYCVGTFKNNKAVKLKYYSPTHEEITFEEFKKH